MQHSYTHARSEEALTGRGGGGYKQPFATDVYFSFCSHEGVGIVRALAVEKGGTERVREKEEPTRQAAGLE